MRIESLITCRANRKVYERLLFSQLNSDESILAVMPMEGDQETPVLPCHLYDIKQTGHLEKTAIAVYPILSTNKASFEVSEFSQEGALLGSRTHSVDFNTAKWQSRINYRIRKKDCSEIRLMDEREPEFGDRSIVLIAAFDAHAYILLRVAITLPIQTNGSDDVSVHIDCIDSAGSHVDHKDVLMGRENRSQYTSTGIRLETFFYSIRVEKGLGDLHLYAWPDSHPDCVVIETIAESNYCHKLDESNAMLYGDAFSDPHYSQWLQNHRSTPFELKQQRSIQFDTIAVFSIVVPLFNTPEPYFREMVDSVISQSYRSWELILVNASPENSNLSTLVLDATKRDDRIRLITLTSNEGISHNTNAGIAEAQGDFICFLDHDDTIEPNALFEYARAINNRQDTDLLYCDEDKLVEDGKCVNPFFKPNFSIDLLRNNNYICHFLAIRKSLLDRIPPNTREFDGAQDYNLVLNASELARHVEHVPHILYHWRMSESSTASNIESKPYATIAGVKAVRNHLSRLGIPAHVEAASRAFTYRVIYDVPDDKPLVSIIIPSKDHIDLLRSCINSIVKKSTYTNYEILIVENNSTEQGTFAYYRELENSDFGARVRILTWNNEFNFSKIINFGVQHARGDYLLLLNNDTEIITPNWIEIMVGVTSRQEVGMVGVKLLYPDNTIQHAGVCFGDLCAGHFFVNLPRENTGYFQLADAQRNLSAVTAACAMTRKDAFIEAGGFDEAYAVAYNDVDYCLSLRQHGYLVVYTPEVEIYHHESITRGPDNASVLTRTRYIRELALLESKWSSFFAQGDPYYNPNLSTSLPELAYYHF